MELLLLLPLIGILLAGIVIGGIFLLIALTFLIYIVSHLYPWLRNISLWGAKARNFFSLSILGILILLIVDDIIFDAYLLSRLTGSNIWLILGILLALLIVPIALFLFIPVDLGIVVWLIRFMVWLYVHWRSLIVGLYYAIRRSIERLRVKLGVLIETEWKIKLAEWKNKIVGIREKATKQVASQLGLAEEEKLTVASLRTGLIMKILSNKLVLRILSIPMVNKMLTRQIHNLMLVRAVLKREKTLADVRTELIMEMLSNKLVIRILSIPIVNKMLTRQIHNLMLVRALLKREKTLADVRTELIMEMLSNKLVIRILSIPIVMKVLTQQAQVLMRIRALLKREKKEIVPEEKIPVVEAPEVPKEKAPAVEAPEVEAPEEEVPKISFRTRLIMGIMSNKLVIKLLSIPIVLKLITKQTQALMWIRSQLKREKKEEVPEVEVPKVEVPEVEVPKVSLRTRLVMKILGNKLVIKILSMPIVLKLLTKMTQVFVRVATLFKRKEKK